MLKFSSNLFVFFLVLFSRYENNFYCKFIPSLSSDGVDIPPCLDLLCDNN